MNNRATILVIEDELMLLEQLSKALEKTGFFVLKSSDADESLKIAEDNPPDLILLDILLPDGGGEELLRNLKSSPKTRDIPVVVLTNLSDEETQTKCLDLGCKYYLIKADYRLDQIAEKVKAILQESKKE